MRGRDFVVLAGLLTFTVGSAARLTSSQLVPGHSLSSFGYLGMEGQRSGGVLWSPDDRHVYTMDTTGRLLTWEAQTGRLIAQRQQQVPGGVKASFPPSLLLIGWQGQQLRLRATYGGEKEVVQEFTAEPLSGKVTLLRGAPAVR